MKNNLPGIDMPFVFFRQSYTTGAPVQKAIKKPGDLQSGLSLQSHTRRAELWIDHQP